MHIVLKGVLGSQAYGLATPESDVDIKGVFVAPFRTVLGLNGPQAVSETKDHSDPDWAYHEVGKFVSLLLKCNPTTLEMLYLNEYLTLAPEMQPLIDNRHIFLSEPGIRGAYGAYAKAQTERLMHRHETGVKGFGSVADKRTQKHGRHCIRLLTQGYRLLQSGELQVDVSADRDFLFEMGELAERDPDRFYKQFIAMKETFDNLEANIPVYNERSKADKLLVELRLAFEDYVEPDVS